MKKALLVFTSLFIIAAGYQANAQDEPKMKDKKKTEEIVIRKKGDKDVNLSIQITGDKVLINGKPIVEFNDDNIVIHKRNITVWNDDHMAMLDKLENMEMENFGFDYNSGSKVMLGVTTEKSNEGAVISKITPGSAAEKAGLKVGDIITKLGDKKIEDSQDLFDAVNDKKPNEEVNIDYKREGNNKSVKVKLQERKENSFGMATPNGMYKSYSLPRKPAAPRVYKDRNNGYGNFNDIDEQVNGAMDYAFSFGRPKLGLKIQDTDDENGVKVLSVEENSSSSKAGMKADDIIVEIGSQKIKNTDEAREALHDNESKSEYKIKARRSGKEMNFDIKIPKKLKTANL
ncbi:MAG: PDZ domain-containing protein [Ferruginibacter sp.]